ncbi:MAG: hypothetical protein Q9163_003458 [Psora crenata]
MPETSSWKSTLKFSDRINNTLKIAEAYQATSENDAVASRAEAKRLEDAAFQSSTAQEEYDRHCQDAILSYHQTLAKKVDVSSSKTENQELPASLEPTSKPAMTVGPYSGCTHHYTGLFSTIYRSRSNTGIPELLAIKATYPATEQAPHNSRREARILSTISHPNIICLLSTHTLKNHDFLLVFPWMPLTLGECLHSSTLVPKSIPRDVFSALACIHGKGILHRDIKPTNILLSTNIGPAFIADFGTAWSTNDPDSEPAEEKITDIGTTCYRSPELLFGCHSYSTGVDLWAAGCVMAEVCHHNAHCRERQTGDWTLFDAGDLGSELALIKSIFETLGTPNEQIWPEAKDLPDWGKMSFFDFPAKPWEQILPGVSSIERDLVSDLVRYESGKRVFAAEILNHDYFADTA